MVNINEKNDALNNQEIPGSETAPTVSFYGGRTGAFLPFFVFVTGVIAIALSGAPAERGFWPVLILALCLGLILARERKNYCEAAIAGMSQPIVMIMLMAWMLASTIGVLMNAAGFVDALVWLAAQLNLSGTAFVLLTFFICCIVSTSTGSSFGTILICSPILYPAGALLGAHLPTLAGAIIGGATFGDSIAPISDTTIAGALSQDADIAGTVRSRLKYVIPAALLALALYLLSAMIGEGFAGETSKTLTGSPKGLPMLIVPVVVIALLLSGRHLLHGLLFGLLIGTAVGLVSGLLPLQKVLYLDTVNFTAKSFIIDGIDRSIGISVFTILLMGLISPLKASGFVDRLVSFSSGEDRGVRAAETKIAAAVGAAVLLTCHSIVAILSVSEYVKKIGQRLDINPYRRANLLSLTVSTFPFILPYFIPVILTANTTAAGAEYGIPSVSPLQAGLFNFYSWMVLGMVIFAILTGFGSASQGAAGEGDGVPSL